MESGRLKRLDKAIRISDAHHVPFPELFVSSGPEPDSPMIAHVWILAPHFTHGFF